MPIRPRILLAQKETTYGTEPSREPDLCPPVDRPSGAACGHCRFWLPHGGSREMAVAGTCLMIVWGKKQGLIAQSARRLRRREFYCGQFDWGTGNA